MRNCECFWVTLDLKFDRALQYRNTECQSQSVNTSRRLVPSFSELGAGWTWGFPAASNLFF